MGGYWELCFELELETGLMLLLGPSASTETSGSGWAKLEIADNYE